MGLNLTNGQKDSGIPGVGAAVSQRDEASIVGQRPIRFGVMFNGAYLQEWQARCIEHLLALNGVELGLFIVDEGDREITFLDKIKQVPADKVLFHLYRKLPPTSRATRRVSMANYLSTVPFIRSRPIRKGKFSQYFTDGDLRTIRSYNLDFILRFAFGIIRGEILNATPWGVWSFHHADEEKFRGGPPCFWEIYRGESLTGAILQRLTPRLDAGIILKKGFVPTHKTSCNRNFDNVAFESARWPADVCLDIRSGNVMCLNGEPSRTTAPVYSLPGTLTMIVFMAKIVRNVLFRK